MSNKKVREVGPIIRWVRNSLVGRDIENPLRYEQHYSPRTQPPPVLPDGPSHKLSGNYYYLRDARRKIETPLAIVGPEELKKLADPSKKENRLINYKGGVKPGRVYEPEYVRKEKKQTYY